MDSREERDRKRMVFTASRPLLASWIAQVEQALDDMEVPQGTEASDDGSVVFTPADRVCELIDYHLLMRDALERVAGTLDAHGAPRTGQIDHETDEGTMTETVDLDLAERVAQLGAERDALRDEVARLRVLAGEVSDG